MRTWDFAARVGLCAISAVWSLMGANLLAQDFLPSVRFSVGDGDWNAAGNWEVAGTDPAENRVPAGDEIAAVNSGIARVGSSVPDVQTLGVRGGGTLSLETDGALNITGDAIIGPGGTLRYAGGTLNAENLVVTGNVSLDAATAGDTSFGNSWQVANSANVLGIPAAVSLDGGSLERGQALRFGTSDTGATVTVGNEPILVIDRATGNASIDNVYGGSLDLKGYSITGSTIGEGWNSLADQGTTGWGEANVTDTRFTEYNLTGASTIDLGGSLGIGTLLSQFVPPTGEDVGFEYILGDGTVAAGPVEYVGPINDLVLQVDPDSGSVAISHQAAQLPDFEVIGYTISSASGSLNPADDAFTGLGEEGWNIFNPQDSALTEVTLEGSKVFSNGTTADLGAIFSGEQDLVFQYAVAGDPNLKFGTVSYGPVVVGPICTPINSLLGDLDGSGDVAFADFLILSGSFGTSVATYEEGDIDCNGSVEFADFLTLSGNFGQSLGGAQAVPEPTGGLLTLVGIIGGVLMFRRKQNVVLCGLAMAATTVLVNPQSVSAQSLDARFIRYHPDSPNGGLNSITESLGVLNGTVIDIIINDDITGSYDIIDLAGDGGTFATNDAYLNGVNDNSMNNFMTYLSGTVTFAAGDYLIGCGSDDGCMINMPGISFIETFNENGPTIAGDGQILFDPGRGHAWTLGTFTVPEGGVTTPFEALSNEGGGGDSFEIAITDFIPDPDLPDDEGFFNDRNNWIANNMFLFEENAVFGLEIVGGPFEGPEQLAGDFNGDGNVDAADADILQANMFSGGGVSSGDITGDGVVNFNDLSAFAPIFEAAGGAGAQAVPEPASSLLALLGLSGLLAFRKKR